MERLLIGIVVLGFMLGTMLAAAWLAVRQPGAGSREETPLQMGDPRELDPPPSELAALLDTALRSSLD